MRLVFAGTPAVALPSLEALLASRHEVVAVVTRPDAPAGRGRHGRRSAIALAAQAAGLPLLQPERASDPAFLAALSGLAPDAAPVVAYGSLLPPAVLAVPRRGWVNLHFSLLPAWRGAAPVQRAVMAGDDVTGATTFTLEEGMDTGPVLGSTTTTIGARDTAGDLLERLALDGAHLLVATLDALEDGALVGIPQGSDGISLAPKVSVEDARVRWEHPALAVDRRVRGCTPEPGAWTTWRGERLKLSPLVPLDAREAATAPALAPGELTLTSAGVLVGTASTPVRLGDVQGAGRRRMDAGSWARGARLAAGERLGDAA